jgi:HPt (histidine-containing phosphotransfer) domain-containing protein
MAYKLTYIDVNDGLKRMMNNTKFYTKMLGKFRNEATVATVESAMNEGNMEKAKIAVHLLKGLSANLSFPELFKQSSELEKQIKEKPIEPDQIETLKTVYEKTLTEIDKVTEQLA